MAKANTSPSHPRYFVGIAASLEDRKALISLIRSLPSGSGHCYFLTLLERSEGMPVVTRALGDRRDLSVREVTSSLDPQPDTLYVAKEGSDLIATHGRIHAVPPFPPAARQVSAGDRLFQSMTSEYGPNSVGIALAHAEASAPESLRKVKEAGGFTVTQLSQGSGRPQASQSADVVLKPDQMGPTLAQIKDRRAEPSDPMIGELRSLDPFFDLIHAETGRNFTGYRPDVLERRIVERMDGLGLSNRDAYLALCTKSPDEIAALSEAMVIPVTSFFRDMPHFLYLARALLPIVGRSPAWAPQIWVAGCSSGEEAYSVAMVAADAFGGLEKMRAAGVRIVATDNDARSLEVARAGRYPKAALDAIPEPYKSSYMTLEGDTASVAPGLRDLVQFEHHDLIGAPPVTSADLICLRNVLIYFQTKSQRRLLTKAYETLRKDGLLFLGSVEHPGASDQRWEQLSPLARIFRKRPVERVAPRDKGAEGTVDNAVALAEAQAANAELQSLGENLQIANEELQAANAELEDANIKLQTANQELVALGEDLLKEVRSMQLREELAETFFSVLPFPALSIDRALRIRGLNAAAMDAFAVSGLAEDLRLEDLTLPGDAPDLQGLCESSWQTLEASDVTLSNGWTLRVIPFGVSTHDGGRLAIVVLTG